MKTPRILPLAITAVSALLAIKLLTALAASDAPFGVAPALASAAGETQAPADDPLAEIELEPVPEAMGTDVDVEDVVDIDAALGLAAPGEHGDAPEEEGPGEAHTEETPVEEAHGDASIEAGHVDEAPAVEAHEDAANEAEPTPEGPPVDVGEVFPESAVEAAVLTALGDRRAELDRRAGELDLRESLLAAAEARIEARLAELHLAEAASTTAEAEAEDTSAALTGVAAMYEAMGPKDAAAVFETLDPAVLVPLASAMAPRKLAAVLAEMTPARAGELTSRLAGLENATATVSAVPASLADLPQITGDPAP